MLKHVQHFTQRGLGALPVRSEIRFYARGSRYFDLQEFSSKDRNQIENSEVINRAPKQLLENSIISEGLLGPQKSRNKNKRSQANHSYRPEVDPSTTSVVLFPGQGLTLMPVTVQPHVYIS